MDKLQFYWQCFKLAVESKLGRVAGIILIILGPIAYFVAPLRGTMNILLWAIPLAIFLAALFLTPYHMFGQKEKEVRNLKNELDNMKSARPKISVEPRVYNERAILEVHNSGGEADFTAKARVISGIPDPELYTMYWESVGRECHINADDSASILVGEISQKNRLQQGILAGGLALFKMGMSGEQVFGAQKMQTKSKEYDGEIRTEYTFEDKCVIEVELTSTPTLVEPFGKRQYALEIDHRGNLLFTSMPTLEG